jgi:hypothetical protein
MSSLKLGDSFIVLQSTSALVKFLSIVRSRVHISMTRRGTKFHAFRATKPAHSAYQRVESLFPLLS